MTFVYITLSALLGFLAGSWCRGLKATEEIQAMHKHLRTILSEIGVER